MKKLSITLIFAVAAVVSLVGTTFALTVADTSASNSSTSATDQTQSTLSSAQAVTVQEQSDTENTGTETTAVTTAYAWSDDKTEWHAVDGAASVFGGDRWEPGYTQMKYFRVECSTAFDFGFDIIAETASSTALNLGDVIDVYYCTADTTGREDFFANAINAGTLTEVIKSAQAVKVGSSDAGSAVFAVALKLQENADVSYSTAATDAFTISIVSQQSSN